MIGLALMGAGTLIGAYAQIQKGQSDFKNAMMQAEEYKRAANEIYLAGERENELIRRKGERIKSAAIASIGQSGTQVSSGSNLSALEEIANNIQIEIEHNKLTNLYKMESYKRKSDMTLQYGTEARDASYISALGGIMQGAGSIYGKAYDGGSGKFGSDSPRISGKDYNPD